MRLMRTTLPHNNLPLEALSRLTHLVVDPSRASTLPPALLEEIVAITNPDIACIYLPSADQRHLHLAASFPKSFWDDPKVLARFATRETTSYAIGLALRERHPVFVDDPRRLLEEGNYVPFSPSIGTEIVLPLLAGQVVTGVLILSRNNSNNFDKQDLALAKVLCDILTILYGHQEESKVRERLIAFLKDITTIHYDDEDQLFFELLHSLHKLLQARIIKLWLYNELEQTLVIRSFYPPTLDGETITFDNIDKKVIPLSQCLSGATVAEKRPMVFNDIQVSNQLATRKFAKRFGLKSLLSFPILTTNNSVLGVVNVFPFALEAPIDAQTLEATGVLISQIARALEISELRQRDRIFFAYDEFFLSMLQSGENRQRWDDLARLMSSQMRCEACSIFLVDSEDRLTLKGSTGIEGNPPYSAVSYNLGEGLTGKCFSDNNPIVYYRDLKDELKRLHVSKHREILLTSGKSRSIALVPIRSSAGAPFGVLRCNNKEESPQRNCGRFTSQDLHLLQRIGFIIADIAQKISWLREKEALMEGYAHRLHHEILSPVDGVLTQMSWLQEHLTGRPQEVSQSKLRNRVDDVIQAARQIEMIVKSIGSLDSAPELVMESFEILPLLHACRGWLRNEASRWAVRVEIGFFQRSRVYADRTQLLRVIYNLLSNAVKYRDSSEPGRYVRIESVEPPDGFGLTFEDNGIGIAATDVGRIFGRGVRGENARRLYPQGAGLGLSYCQNIILAHGGTIEVTSPRKPTIFSLYIPELAR